MASDAALPDTETTAAGARDEPVDDADRTLLRSGLGELLDTPIDSGSESAVRAIFADIGNEETTARIESRIDALEDELERADRRLHDHERARRGELDVMRARVEDVLEAVEAALGDARQGQIEAETRLLELVEQVRAEQEQRVASLRDEVAPAVARLLKVTEGLTGRTKSTGEAQERQGARLDELAAGVDGLREELRTTTTKARAEAIDRIESVEADLAGRVDRVGSDVTARLGKLDAALRDKVAAAENALRGALGDVQANVRAEVDRRESALQGALEEAIASVRQSLRADGQDREEALAELQAELGELRGETALKFSEVERLASQAAQSVKDEVAQAVAGQQEQLDRSLADQRQGIDQAVAAQSAALDQATAGMQRQIADVAAEARKRIGDLEARWVADTVDLGRSMESAMGRAEDRVTKERADRSAAVDRLVERLDQVTGRLDRLEDGVQPAAERLSPSAESLRLDLDEVGARVSALQAQVANAIGSMATELSARVSKVQGELDALRDEYRGG